MAKHELMFDDREMSLVAEDAWRITRLNRVLGYACALADRDHARGLLGKVDALRDEEGWLTVTWKASPSDRDKAYFVKAWESVIGDGCDNVGHEVA